MNELNKTVCIYHSIDLDGWMSAAIVALSYNNSLLSNIPVDFIGYNHGDPIPDLVQYNKVIMVDISFDIQTMHTLNASKEFIWIDHHISALRKLEDILIDGKQDTMFAACELAWMYFFPDKVMPEIVRLLGRYDCFGHKGTDEEQKVLEFQYGARAVIQHVTHAYNALRLNIIDRENFSNSFILGIQLEGIAIYKYLSVDAKQSYNNKFKLYFRQDVLTGDITQNAIFTFCAINKERFNPINFGIDYHREGYDGCACFYFDGKQYNFSLYNDDGEVDVSKIAAIFGGGGHAGAAGFRLSPIEFYDLINNRR